MKNKERWVWIPGFEWYQVSNLGRVRSVNRKMFALDPWGRYRSRCFKGRVLKQNPLKNGYLTVNLCAFKQKPKPFYTHRLVLSAFVGECPKGFECCHGDGTRDNNNLKNLRYDSRRNNALDRHKHGTMQPRRGEESPSAKLTWKKVKIIRELKGSVSSRKLARRFKISKTAILGVWNEKYWKGGG